MKPTIIIGAGLAGYTVARELRKLDKSKPLLIISADDGGFYSKPMLSNAYAQQRSPAQLISQDAAQMAAQLGANILAGTRVNGIDTIRKSVQTSAGDFEYGQLVLAVGAQPIKLGLEGNAAHEVLSVNHLSDYAGLRQRIQAAGAQARVTILGAGLIGCEFADDLAGGGHAVTLVDPNPGPLAALAAPALSEALRAALEARRVEFKLGTTAARVQRDGKVLTVTLADGRSHETDVVLSAVGLRPDLGLAQAAGIASGRGITVDIHGATSARDVYALGDCVEYPVDGAALCMPYIAPLMSAARALARTLSGTPTPIDLRPTPVIVKTPSFPLAVLPVAPAALAGGSWHSVDDGQRLIARFRDAEGIVRGFGVAPQDAAVRQALLAEVGTAVALAA